MRNSCADPPAHRLWLLSILLLGVMILSFASLTGASTMGALEADDIVLLYYVQGERPGPSYYHPYVAYIDDDGRPKAWFFDAFLYTAAGTLQGSYEWANPLFEDGIYLDALNDAIAQAALVLGEPPSKRLIYMAMPVMSGSVDERINRNRRYIESVRAMWTDKEYQYLQLGGFYWTHEGIRDPQARETVTWTYDYIHSLTGSEPGRKSVV